MKISPRQIALAAALAIYIVLDVLLTPPAGFETRPVSHVTGLGFVTLGLLFLGLALAIVSLVLLFRPVKARATRRDHRSRAHCARRDG